MVKLIEKYEEFLTKAQELNEINYELGEGHHLTMGVEELVDELKEKLECLKSKDICDDCKEQINDFM